MTDNRAVKKTVFRTRQEQLEQEVANARTIQQRESVNAFDAEQKLAKASARIIEQQAVNAALRASVRRLENELAVCRAREEA